MFAFVGSNRMVAPSSIKQICSKILINLAIKISLNNFIAIVLNAKLEKNIENFWSVCKFYITLHSQTAG